MWPNDPGWTGQSTSLFCLLEGHAHVPHHCHQSFLRGTKGARNTGTQHSERPKTNLRSLGIPQFLFDSYHIFLFLFQIYNVGIFLISPLCLCNLTLSVSLFLSSAQLLNLSWLKAKSFSFWYTIEWMWRQLRQEYPQSVSSRPSKIHYPYLWFPYIHSLIGTIMNILNLCFVGFL